MTRIVLLACLAALGPALVAPANAQGLPDSVRSASLSREQADELNRRLASLQSRLTLLANETQLREAAVRNIAIEIFGARPDLDFASYSTLIESGARELQTYIRLARERSSVDPALADLRGRAIAAAEEGHITIARSLYDELIAENRQAREEQRATENLMDAADIAESARLSFIATDYYGSALRYGRAAAIAPAETHERGLYVLAQAAALREQGERFADVSAIESAIVLLRALSVDVINEGRIDDAAGTLNDLGLAQSTLGEWGNWDALRESRDAFQRALSLDPPVEVKALILMNLGLTLRMLGERDEPHSLPESIQVLTEAVTLFESVSSMQAVSARANLGASYLALGEAGDRDALTRSMAVLSQVLLEIHPDNNFELWVKVQTNLGNAYRIHGSRYDVTSLGRAIAIHTAALARLPRDRYPSLWALMQNNLGVAYFYTNLGTGDAEALQQAISAYRAALSELSPTTNLDGWADTQLNLATALSRYDLSQSEIAIISVLNVVSERQNANIWGDAQHALGITLQKAAIERRGDTNLEDRSVAALEAALSVRRPGSPDWALSQFSLGNSYSLMALGGRGSFETAIEAYQRSLQVRTIESDPIGFADSQGAMAWAYDALAREGNAAARGAAREAGEASLRGYEVAGDASRAAEAREFLRRLSTK